MTIASLTDVATGLAYEPFGSVKGITYANGRRLIVNWADEGRLAGRRLYRLSDGSNLAFHSYGYDSDENIVRITDKLDATKSISYAYDAMSRLRRSVREEGALKREDYVHDLNGMDQRVATTRGADTRRFVYDQQGRVLGEYGATPADVRAEFISPPHGPY